jgi:RND family efflux transporter MFP subunit
MRVRASSILKRFFLWRWQILYFPRERPSCEREGYGPGGRAGENGCSQKFDTCAVRKPLNNEDPTMFILRLPLVAALTLAAGVASGQVAEEAVQSQGTEGFTEPFRKFDLIPPEVGIISRLLVREGDRVQKNQLLGSLDCDVQQVALELAEANLAAHGKLDSAQADRDLRRRRLAKLRKLHEMGHANEEEVLRAESELAVAEANVLVALEQDIADSLEVKRIAATIERRTFRSPTSGVVTRIYHEEKDMVGSNASPVLTIMEVDKLRVTFTIPTVQATQLKTGQGIPVMFINGQKAKGTIEFISPVTEADSDTVRVKVLIDNPQGKYRCGVRCWINSEKLP